MTDLEAIRKRHAQEEEHRQVCPCSLCQKHVDRGKLLAMVDDLGRQLDNAETTVASLSRMYDE